MLLCQRGPSFIYGGTWNESGIAQARWRRKERPMMATFYFSASLKILRLLVLKYQIYTLFRSISSPLTTECILCHL